MKRVYSLKELRVQLYSARERDFSPTWKIGETDLPFTVMWYVLEGERHIEVGEKKIKVGKGNIVIFPQKVPVVVHEHHESLSILNFAMEVLIGHFNLFNLYKFPVVTEYRDTDSFNEFLALWKEIIEKWSARAKLKEIHTLKPGIRVGESVEFLQITALLNEWIIQLINLTQPKEIPISIDSRIQRTIYFIHNNLAKQLSVSVLANQVYLSESYFSHLFKEVTGITPMDYVKNARLDKASELLTTTDYRVKEIAEIVGFVEHSQLSRAFQQRFGMSPSEYRQQNNFF